MVGAQHNIKTLKLNNKSHKLNAKVSVLLLEVRRTTIGSLLEHRRTTVGSLHKNHQTTTKNLSKIILRGNNNYS